MHHDSFGATEIQQSKKLGILVEKVISTFATMLSTIETRVLLSFDPPCLVFALRTFNKPFKSGDKSFTISAKLCATPKIQEL